MNPRSSRKRVTYTPLYGVLLAALAWPLQSASAVDIENSFTLGALGVPSATTFHNVIAGTSGKSFLDHWLFELGSAALGNAATVTMQSYNNAYKIAPSSFMSNLYLQGSGAPVALGGNSTFPGGAVTYIGYTALAAGKYDLQISGLLAGNTGGSYGGTLSVEPIPEPGAFAMMAAGFGLMMYVMRRRSDKK